MPDAAGNVLRDTPRISETHFRNLFAADVTDAVARHGKGELASAMRRCPRSIDNMITGGKAGPDAVFSLLAADPSAFARLQKAFGISVSLREGVVETPTMVEAADLVGAAAKLVQALADGKLDHLEVLFLDGIFRPLMPSLQALFDQADAVRGPRAVA